MTETYNLNAFASWQEDPQLKEVQRLSINYLAARLYLKARSQWLLAESLIGLNHPDRHAIQQKWDISPAKIRNVILLISVYYRQAQPESDDYVNRDMFPKSTVFEGLTSEQIKNNRWLAWAEDEFDRLVTIPEIVRGIIAAALPWNYKLGYAREDEVLDYLKDRYNASSWLKITDS